MLEEIGGLSQKIDGSANRCFYFNFDPGAANLNCCDKTFLS